MSTPSGQVYLCKNAIVDRNYSHTIDFKSPSEQQAYWGSLIKYSMTEFTYIRRQRQFIRVDKTLDELQDVNYLYYRAKENSKLYYCFVTDKEYFSDNTTYVYFETDVLQTYMFDYEVKQSYVLQEHCDRWDANHKPIYSRTEENLDYGSEYTVESAYKVMPVTDYGGFSWYLALCKTHSELVESGEASENTQILCHNNPFCIYLLPASNQGITLLHFNNANTTIGTVEMFMKAMSKTALGDYVQQIIKIPYLPFDMSINTSNTLPTLILNDSRVMAGTTMLSGTNFIKLKTISPVIDNPEELRYGRLSKLLAEMNVIEGIESALPTEEQWTKVTTNPHTTERDKRFESKLLTHPYRYNLLTDWKGQPITIKNEYIGGDKIKVNYTQGLGMNAPTRYWLEDYKKDPEGRGSSLLQLTPEDAPIINDAYYTYMLQNRNQISANQTNAITSAVANVGTGLVSGIFGGVGGAVLGAVTGTVGGAVNYQNMVRSENAKQKDLKNVPDTIINSNDASFNIMDGNEYITFYRMKICCEFEELLADTFAMTGYTVKRMKVPNLKSRVRYNYVKTVGANIVGSFDQNDLSMIKAIFDNGVTFWHYNTVNFKPFDYSLENIETKLIKG